MKNVAKGSIIFLLLSFLTSCVDIVDNDQVAKDTLEKLKEKYNEDFSVVSVSNSTQGHGKGAIWPTGNAFTIELNSQPDSTGQLATWFLAYAAYDSNKQFVYYGDTYIQRLISDQIEKDFSEILKSGYPGRIACNMYFETNDDYSLTPSGPVDVDYKNILPKHPYSISISSGTIYFFTPYPASEKETTEYLRKYFTGLQRYKPASIDLFVYYWDEDHLKEKSIDSLRFAFAYEYHDGYFETGKTPLRRYRLKLGKDELDHLDTLNLYRYMKDF